MIMMMMMNTTTIKNNIVMKMTIHFILDVCTPLWKQLINYSQRVCFLVLFLPPDFIHIHIKKTSKEDVEKHH